MMRYLEFAGRSGHKLRRFCGRILSFGYGLNQEQRYVHLAYSLPHSLWAPPVEPHKIPTSIKVDLTYQKLPTIGRSS